MGANMELRVTNGHQHRLDRLNKVIRIATAICGITEPQANELIESIDDDRGTLVVRWTHPPSDIQRRAFSVAWEQSGETPDKVIHQTS